MKARLISLNNVMSVKEIIVAVICILSKDITVALKVQYIFYIFLFYFIFIFFGGGAAVIL